MKQAKKIALKQKFENVKLQFKIKFIKLFGGVNWKRRFKNSDFKVIRINFEEGTIDRDYQEKWYCNFGELRRITKEDLKQFEKQEENTSEN